jgi:hypothetical protein
MTNGMSDFIGTVKSVKQSIRALKGITKLTKMGSVCWAITDNQGETHNIHLDNVFDCASLPFQNPFPTTLGSDPQKQRSRQSKIHYRWRHYYTTLAWHHTAPPQENNIKR